MSTNEVVANESAELMPPLDWAKEDAALATIIGPGYSYRDQGPGLVGALKATERDLKVLHYYRTYPNVFEGAGLIATQDLITSSWALVKSVKVTRRRVLAIGSLLALGLYVVGKRS